MVTCCSSRAAVSTFWEKLLGSKTIHLREGGRSRRRRAKGERGSTPRDDEGEYGSWLGLEVLEVGDEIGGPAGVPQAQG